MSNLSNALKVAALTAALGAGMTYASKADAVLIMSTTMGAACKASSGPGADLFYFSNLYAENVSPAVQYLTCITPDLVDSTVGATDVPVIVEWAMRNGGTAAVDATCVIQNGFLYTGVTVTYAIVTKTAVPAGGDVIFAVGPTTTPALPARATYMFSPYSLNCGAPAASRFNLLHTNVNGTKA